MKELHLLCNAHLDPVWQWQRPEGMAEALSTFRVAAEFCEEFDSFVFNHNESLLYEWVEEYEPELFEKIKKLVKEGKWRIMGGWYLQPDCLMPSGESFIRQIKTGRNYFMEKFGVKPETAINFDPFGHSRGLVQILKKFGYNSYVFMRPWEFVPERDFIWCGYDGSEIYAHSTNSAYGTHYHEVPKAIDEALEKAHNGANLMLWGVGNHGGGPSRCDILDIEEYRKAHPDVNIIHSWCENYFDKLDKTSLKPVETSLVHCMVGCYTSMVRIKQLNRKLENELSLCEKMLALSGVEYDKNLLKKAEKALMFCQFHDILPGSMVKKSEEESIRLLNFGSEIAAKLSMKAFFKLCEGQEKGKQGEIPVMIFNPHPYDIEQEIEFEFQLQDQNWTPNQITTVRVRTEDGKILPAQNEKESSTIAIDWRKRVVFKVPLKAMSMNRFDLELTPLDVPKRVIAPCEQNDTHFIFNNENMELLINKKTGLIDKYTVGGINYLKENSAEISVYKDNEDPWGMYIDGFYEKIGEFRAVSKKEANEFNGYPDFESENVRVIENGEIRTKIQAVLKHQNSYAVLEYTIPKHDNYVNIKVKTLANDVNVLYKLGFNTVLDNGDFVGQQVFGSESMLKEEKEVTFQKWCGLFEKNMGFAVLNRGTYGGSAKDGHLNLTLMRTPVYCGHPIFDRPITDQDRSFDHIDMGEREFEFKIMADCGKVEREAEIFNQPPAAFYFFPPGTGEKKDTEVILTNADILLTSYRIDNGELKIRLFNTKNKNNFTGLKIKGLCFDIEFSPFEIKTFILDKKDIIETDTL